MTQLVDEFAGEMMRMASRLLSAKDISKTLGISRTNAFRVIHAQGIMIGGRYYITADNLDRAINGVGAITTETRKPAKKTRPYNVRNIR